MVGTFEGNVELIVEGTAIEERAYVHTARKGIAVAQMQSFGGEVDRFAVQGEGGIVRKAAEVTDGKEEFGAVGAEPFETFGTELFGQDEMAVLRLKHDPNVGIQNLNCVLEMYEVNEDRQVIFT